MGRLHREIMRLEIQRRKGGLPRSLTGLFTNLGVLRMDILTRKEICYLFDSTNLTIKQVASRFGLTEAEVKKILMDDAWGSK